MKKIVLLVILFVGFSGFSFSQQANDYFEIVRSTFHTEKKALITESMELTQEESEPFWTLYNEYMGKVTEVNNKRIKSYVSFADGFENMTSEKAKEILADLAKVRVDLAKIDNTYTKKFQKVLSPQKTLRFFQLENKIRVTVDAQLAEEIPLLGDSDEKK